jgi:hypothetical protein
MGMYVVEKHLTFSALRGIQVSWHIVNRKTGEVVGCQQQLGIANALAAGMSRGV